MRYLVGKGDVMGVSQKLSYNYRISSAAGFLKDRVDNAQVLRCIGWLFSGIRNKFVGRGSAKAILLAASAVVCFSGVASLFYSPEDVFSSERPAIVDTRSVDFVSKLGISGNINCYTVGKFTDEGPDVIIVGTSDGAYAISEGVLKNFMYSPFGVSHVCLVGDVSDDGHKDLVLTLDKSDTPLVCCYDGYTGKVIWRSGVYQKIFVKDVGWSDLQLGVSDIKVIDCEGYQLVVAVSGRKIFAFHSMDGREAWKFESSSDLECVEVISDTNGNSIRDIAVGSKDGYLYIISGENGRLLWKKKIAGSYKETYGEVTQAAVSSIVESGDGGVFVCSQDGKMLLIDVDSRKIEKTVSLPSESYPVNDRLVSLRGPAGICEGILAVSIPSGSMVKSPMVFVDSSPSSTIVQFGVTLFDLEGNEIWNREIYSYSDFGIETGTYNGKLVIFEPHPAQGLRMVGVADGNVMAHVDIGGFSSVPNIVQFGDNFVTFSNDGDVLAISSRNLGNLIWCYPRAGDMEERGEAYFSGRQVVIFSTGESNSARAIYAVDMLTGSCLWRYEVPYIDFIYHGGLSDIAVVPDLFEDKVVGFRGAEIFVFCSSNGNMTKFALSSDIGSLQIIDIAGTRAIMASVADGSTIVDISGKEIWHSNLSDVQILDDINGDDIGDIISCSSEGIIILDSVKGDSLKFVPQAGIYPEEDKDLGLYGLVKDTNGDGIREIAYFEYDRQVFRSYGSYKDKFLYVASPKDGRVFVKISQDRDCLEEISCCDVNGDGFLDSLVYFGVYTDYSTNKYDCPKLEVLSGKDGSILWKYQFQNFYQSIGVLPARFVDDVDGDGISDLAISCVDCGKNKILIYSVSKNCLIKTIVIFPTQVSSDLQAKTFAPGSGVELLDDVNGDGHNEIVSQVSVGVGKVLDRKCYTIVDVYNGSLLSGLLFDGSIAFGVLDNGMVFTDGGGICKLDTSSVGDLHVTQPRMNIWISSVKLSWDGNGFSEVFVDGRKSAFADGEKVRLLLPNGEHEVILCSVDEYGRVSYREVCFRMKTLPLYAVVAVFFSIGSMLLYFSARLAMYSRRKHWKGRFNVS